MGKSLPGFIDPLKRARSIVSAFFFLASFCVPQLASASLLSELSSFSQVRLPFPWPFVDGTTRAFRKQNALEKKKKQVEPRTRPNQQTKGGRRTRATTKNTGRPLGKLVVMLCPSRCRPFSSLSLFTLSCKRRRAIGRSSFLRLASSSDLDLLTFVWLPFFLTAARLHAVDPITISIRLL